MRDVLMLTSGLSYGGDTAHPGDQQYAGLRDESMSLEAMVEKMSEIQLKFHPGTRWHYSFSTDVGARRLLSRRLAASAPGGARTSRRDSARRGRGATG